MTRSLIESCISIIIDASIFRLVCLFEEAERKTFQVNESV